MVAVQATAILALWAATRPYYGIIHDAQLYAVRALAALDPAAYRGDLYLAFGSQDSYTLFAPAYAVLVGALGLGPAHMLGLAVGQAAWLAALVWLATGLIPERRAALAAVAAAIALPGSYGARQILSYGEPFLTPRLPAEALCLAALGLLARGRRGPAIACLAAALAIHPVAAAPGLAAALCWLAWQDRRWLAALVALPAAALLLALAGLSPFDRLLLRLDGAWRAIILRRDLIAFVGQWGWLDYVQLLTTFTLAGLGLAAGGPGLRRLLAVATPLAVAGLLAAGLGGDVLGNLLVFQLQPWRVLWLLALAGNLAAAGLLLRRPAPAPGWQPSRLLLPLGVAALVGARLTQAAFLPAALLLVAGAAALALEAGGRPVRAWVAGVLLVPVLSAATAAVVLILALLPRNALFWADLRQMAAAAAGLGLALAAGCEPRRTVVRGLAGGLAAALLLLAAVGWDHRDPRQRMIEAGMPGAADQLLPPGASVYWESGIEDLWFGLRRASFWSCLQSAGAGFFRDNALTYARRRDSLALLGTFDFDNPPDDFCPHRPEALPPVSRATLAEACRREPGLDYLVLRHGVPGSFVARWQPAWSSGELFIYRCEDLRR
jgi:hypothetical protein